MMFHVVFCSSEIAGWTSDKKEAQDRQNELLASSCADVTISDTSDINVRDALVAWIKGRLAA